MTIEDLKQKQLILLECISGSRAYNLATPTSDTDIKGVFYLPKEQFYGLNYIPQITDETNDTVYYELGRFVDLLLKNNPNIIELLATPEDKIRIKHPLMDQFKATHFLSKKCKDTFGGYAFTQIKKARGLKKKIVNPMQKEKKSIVDFCYILDKHNAISLQKWLTDNNKNQAKIGLVNIPHFKDTYGVYYDEENTLGYKGILRKTKATSVLLSSIPKSEQLITHLQFNEQGYVKYCKDYKAYWEWVEKRNAARYENNIEHGKNYDSKNMMHTFRLLDMAEEILSTGQVIVERPNRDELLAIKKGSWTYDELIEKAQEKMKSIETAHMISQLPEQPDRNEIEQILVGIREQLYKS